MNRALGPALCVVWFVMGAGGFAEEIRGLVSEVSGTTISISVQAAERPKPGDDVEIFVVLPGDKGVAVLANGRVTGINEKSITAEITKATGKVEANQFARIRAAVAAPIAGTPTAVAAPAPKTSPAPPPGPPPSAPATPVEPPKVAPSQLPADLPPKENPPGSSPNLAPTGVAPGNFAETVNRYSKAIFLAGDPTKGSGTAFVISRKHRLLATNAHVADITDRVILNHSRTVYRVVKKWYHPGVIRRMDDGKTHVHSDKPSDGVVEPHCPDLAILQLEAAGADLPVEIPLTGSADLLHIQGSEIGVLGYPGYQRDQSIAKRDLLASATFIKGTISRMTGYDHEPDLPPEQQRMVHFSAPLYPGFSGSPAFLPDGRVVVIANHLHREAEQLGYGVRCDALWELLEHAELAQFVPGADQVLGAVRASYVAPRPEPRVQTLREAMQYVNEAEDFRHHHDFEEAYEHIEKAIAILPDYWRPYWQRGVVIDHSIKHGNTTLTKAARLKLHRSALEDNLRAAQLYRDGFGKANHRITLDVAREYINLGRLTNEKQYYEKGVDMLTDPAVIKNATDDGGYLFAIRGCIKQDLNDLAGSLEDLNLAIRSDPARSDYYTARAAVWQKLGQKDAAARDTRKAGELHAKEHEGHEHIAPGKAGHNHNHGHKH